ncbi:MAG: hypothetical protein JXQ96_12150 [Cyclobacteriaceae bacterium]
MKKFVLLFAIAAMTACGSSNSKKTETESKPEPEAPKKEMAAEEPNSDSKFDEKEITSLLNKSTCTACHKTDQRLVGPPFTEIAKRNYSDERIVELIYKPEPENWPDYAVPMIGLPHLPKEDMMKIAGWINSLN